MFLLLTNRAEFVVDSALEALVFLLQQSKGSYGGNLMPGEGDAMAAFVEAGERIPRRGEVGMTAADIDQFEDLGFVMSGSRHRRMNAVRLRKENQVYNAEEQRALAMYNYEEKAASEAEVISGLRELLQKKNQSLESTVDDKFRSIGQQKKHI